MRLKDLALGKALAWYSHLAVQPGWKEYVWHQVKTMAKESPDLFRDLPALLTERVKREQASTQAHRTK